MEDYMKDFVKKNNTHNFLLTNHQIGETTIKKIICSNFYINDSLRRVVIE